MRELQLAFISDRVTRRIFKILSLIERNHLFTIGGLADTIKVTERTIANDVRDIRNYFGESIEMTSDYSGFVFEEKNLTLYHKKKQKLLENECLFEIISNIFYGKLFQISELADYYHYSETSFRRMLNQSEPILESYGLHWESNPLSIQGDEASLRKFFKDFYYEGEETIYTLLPADELEALVLAKLKDRLGNYEIGSGATPAAFYYTFFIAITRARLGYTISLPSDLIELAYTGSDFSLLYSLKESIEALYGVSITKVEFAWIYLVTICERTLDRADQEETFYEHFHQGEQIADLSERFLQNYGIAAGKSPPIATFARSFLLSRVMNHRLSPSLNKEMVEFKEAVLPSIQETVDRNLQFLKNAHSLLAVSPYLEDICISLTFYSELIIDLYTPPKTIYFLLEGDHFICQYIRTRVLQQFGEKHRITFLPLQKVTNEVLSRPEIDLIVTNYNRYLINFDIQTETLLLKAVPDGRDWERLEKKINPFHKQLI